MKYNILANYIGKFWSIISGFLFIPLYIKYLGFEGYSIISFTLLISGVLGILDVGLTATLSREFSKATNNNLIERKTILRTLETLYFSVVILCIVIVSSFSKIIAEKWINQYAYNTEYISFLLKIIGINVGFQLLFRFYTGGLLGLEKQVIANIFQIIWGIFHNALVIIGIIFVPTLKMFFIWQTLTTVIFTIFIRIFLENKVTGVYKLNVKFEINNKVLSQIWKFAGGMFLISVVAVINTQMDKIVISKLLPVETLAYYTLAVVVSQVPIFFVNPISTALLPRFTNLYSMEKKEEARHLFTKICLPVSIIVFSVMANMIFFSNEIIWIWTGNMEIAQKVSVVLPIIIISMSMLSLALIPYTVAIANGYTLLNNIMGLVSLIITLPGYWIVTKFYGSLGAAFVFCSVQTITTIIYLYYINKKYIGLKILKDIYIHLIILPFFLSVIVVFGFSHIFSYQYSSRIMMLFRVGFTLIFTLVIVSLILIPFKNIKQIFLQRTI